MVNNNPVETKTLTNQELKEDGTVSDVAPDKVLTKPPLPSSTSCQASTSFLHETLMAEEPTCSIPHNWAKEKSIKYLSRERVRLYREIRKKLKEAAEGDIIKQQQIMEEMEDQLDHMKKMLEEKKKCNELLQSLIQVLVQANNALI